MAVKNKVTSNWLYKVTSNWLNIATGLTVVYIVFIMFAADVSLNIADRTPTCTQSGLLAAWFGCLTLNELGDFLAGAFAPLAFIWLAAAVLIQSQELKAQRRELTLTHESITENREVMKAQVNEARNQAQFIGQQTKILEREQKSREDQEKADIFDAAVRRLAGRIKDSPPALTFRNSDNKPIGGVPLAKLASFNGPATEFIREVSNNLALRILEGDRAKHRVCTVDTNGFRNICDACDEALRYYEELPSKAQIDAQTCNLQYLRNNLYKVFPPD